MRGQLRQIESRLRRFRQRLGQERLGRLPEALREYAATGQVPDDPTAAAYVRLNEAALDAMNTSVSGADHEAAAQAYERALADWQQVLKGGVL
jgi:hypothetical protein